MEKKKKAAKKQQKKKGKKKPYRSRSAKTGEFVTHEQAAKHPDTTVNEKIK